MPLLTDIATEHQERRIRLADRTASRVRAMWRQADVRALDASWDATGPALAGQVAAAQVTAARQSGPYVNRVASAAGDSVGRASLEPVSFAGVMADGRAVESALFGAVVTTKRAIGAGIAPQLAFEAGAAFLGVLVKAAIHDAGRGADATSAAAKGYTRYVRAVSAGACSRCAILAGAWSYSTAFERHPACKCTALPVKDDTKIPDGGFTSPKDYFESLSKAQQDRVFTKAGAESIRLGADPVSVVNARRGSRAGSRALRAATPAELRRSSLTRIQIGRNADGSPILGYVTGEGGTRRGGFGRLNESIGGVANQRLPGARYSSTTRARLMPESIMQLTDDVDTRRLLLRDAGYLQHPIANTSNNDWMADRLAAQRQDRLAADAFYASHGIRLS